MPGINRDLQNLMEQNGFVLIRKNKHLIWQRGPHRITTALTPSDWRVLRNLKARIRRYDRELAYAKD
jgi:hypothetical protein